MTDRVRPARAWMRIAAKASIVCLALVGLFLPTNRVYDHAYPILFGIPLLVAAFRRSEDEAFRLWALYALSFVVFCVLRNVADETGVVPQARYVILADRLLGFGVLPTVRLQAWLHSGAAVRIVDWVAVCTHLSYYVVPPLVGVALWVGDRPIFPYYMVAISLTYLVGIAFHFIVPTVPPWMANEQGLIPPIDRLLHDTIAQVSPSAYEYGYRVAGGNEVAAMPSLHAATAGLVALARWRIPRARWVAFGYAVLMALALTYLGEHYLIDCVAGVLLAWAAWKVSILYTAPLAQGRNLSRSENLS